MFDSTYPTSATVEKLHTARALEPWRANTLVIGLHLVLLATHLPAWVQAPAAHLATRCIRQIGPLFTDEVIQAWTIAWGGRSISLYARALCEVASALCHWRIG